MGWWSTTIMGGDTPLDFEGRIYEALGIEMFGKRGYNEIPKKKFEDKQNDVVKAIEELGKKGWDVQIGLQTLGVMMMKSGAKINRKNKPLIIDAAESDEWAKEDKERRKHVNNFVTALRSFTGKKKVLITNEGLFEAFEKHKGPGLINKNV
jgi:hypothetical protein